MQILWGNTNFRMYYNLINDQKVNKFTGFLSIWLFGFSLWIPYK